MKNILCLSFWLLAFSSSINACTCTTPTIEKGFMKSSLVLHGKVISKTQVSRRSLRNPKELAESISRLKEKYINNNSDSISEIRVNSFLRALDSKSITKVEIVVIDFFKNQFQLSDTLTIYTRGGLSCGYSNFEIGKEFIVYGTKSKNGFNRNPLNTFWTNTCSRTKNVNKKELKNLRKLAQISFDKKSLIITVKALVKRDLIDSKKDTINVIVPRYNHNLENIGAFKIQDKILAFSSTVSIENPFDIILSNLQIDKNYNLEISFKSNDRNGRKYQGFVTLKYKGKRVKFGDISYLSAIE